MEISRRAASRGLDPALAIAFCAVVVLVVSLPAILNDGDTLWQIRAGEWILDHGRFPHIDVLSFTAGDHHWSSHEWFSYVLMALAWRAGGMGGVMALFAGSAGLAAALVLYRLRRFLPGVYAALGLVIAFSNTLPSLLARPHLLAWPCLCLWCGALISARARKAAPPVWLIPLMLLWVNMHGSFIVGLLVAGGLALEAFTERGADRVRVLRDWGLFLAAAGAVTLANPDFLTGVLFPLHVVGLKSLAWTGDWAPTDFGRMQPLELVILGCLALGFTGKVSLPPMRLLMLLGLIHGALTHERNEQLLGLIGVLILAEPLGAALGRGAAIPMKIPSRIGVTAAAAVAIVAMGARLLIPLGPERTGAAFAAVMAHVPTSLRSQPVLNDYVLGGKLIFDGERPFIDSRSDLFGDEFEILYRSIVSPDRATLERTLADYHIAWTIFARDQRVIELLDNQPGWRRLGEFDGLVIHVRTN